MDTTGFDPQEDLNQLEEPLAVLRPLTRNLSRDRMLFEAGRASAHALARRRFLMFASTSLVVVFGLGLSLVRERSRRQAFEVALAGLERMQTPPPSSPIPPVSIAANDISPFSYRALSLLENLGDLDESRPVAGAGQPDRTPRGVRPEPIPLRVRDTTKLLDL